MPHRTTHALSFVLALTLLALGAPAHADDAGTTQAGLQLEGRLGTRTVTKDGEKRTLYQIPVGGTTYEIDTAGVEADALRKAKGKYVTLLVEDGATFAVQQRAPLAGTVRAAKEGKKTVYRLETPEGLWQIPARDVRKFKKFVDVHVEATCYRVSDGRFRAVDKVKSVERKLLPGERDPQSGAEAIGTKWMGTLTAVKVPKGIPGVKPGDFPIAFKSDATLESTEGRLMRSYDVVGLRARKFNRKKRTATIEVAYSFGQGSYAIMLHGTFGEDWKTFTGDWKSGFLGSGTFVIAMDERPAK